MSNEYEAGIGAGRALMRTLVVAVCADAQRDGRKIDPDELLAALEARHV